RISAGRAQGRVEGVAEPVSEEVEAQYGEEDRQPREGGDPPGGGQELAALDDHVAPAGKWGLGPQAQVAQPGLDEDRPGEQERGLDDDDGQGVDQEVTAEDPPVAGAEGAGGVHELAGPEAQALAADDAGHGSPGHEADDESGVGDAGAEER